MPRTTGVLAAVAASAALLAGCGGSGSAAPAAAPSASPSVSPCPTPDAQRSAPWPGRVPSDLPKPPGVTIVSRQTTGEGVLLVRFRTPTSLRQSVLFVVERLPKAGYLLGRGDAEAGEADAPFVHGDVRGVLRMVAVAACRTEWLLATVRSTLPGGTSPLLPSHRPSASSSALPFG